MQLYARPEKDGGYLVLDSLAAPVYTLCVDFIFDYPKCVEVPPVDLGDTPGIVWILRAIDGSYRDHHEDLEALIARNNILIAKQITKV